MASPIARWKQKAKGAARRGNRRAARPRCEGVGACFLARIGSPTASTFAEGRDNGEQITVWGRLRVSRKTAAEYRVMADKCFKWARNTYMDEARETYLQLAQFWLDVASKLDGPPGSQQV
jgi:hypothetical protein